MRNILPHTSSHSKFRLCLHYISLAPLFRKLGRAEEKSETAESLPHERVCFSKILHNNMTMTQRPRWKISACDNPIQLVPHLVVGLNITTQSSWTSLRWSRQHIFAVINTYLYIYYPNYQSHGSGVTCMAAATYQREGWWRQRGRHLRLNSLQTSDLQYQPALLLPLYSVTAPLSSPRSLPPSLLLFSPSSHNLSLWYN